MSEAKKEWWFSRGDAELYDKCGYARYLRTIYGERGIVRVGSSFPLSLGRIVHKATERVLKQETSLSEAAIYAGLAIEKVVLSGEIPPQVWEECQDQFSREAIALASGLVWTWGLYVLPNILRDYDIVNVEGRTVLHKDGFALPTVGDLLLRSKDDGTLVYPDWKTAGFTNGAWMDSWNRSAQLHTTASAIEQTIGEEVEYCYVQALVKGRWSGGYQHSPLCWGYQNPGTDEERTKKGDSEPTPEWLYKHTARKGWTLQPQWTSGMSIEQWVRGMPREVALTIVPRTPPIIVDPSLVDTWWRQRIIKEARIRDAKGELADAKAKLAPKWEQHIIDTVFPSDFTQCKPVIGFDCDYCDICHNAGVADDPIGSGLYKRRSTFQERMKEEAANETQPKQ